MTGRNAHDLSSTTVLPTDRWSAEVDEPLDRASVVRSMLETSAPDEPFADLTPRQREVLQRVAGRQTSRDLAARLGPIVKTAESHRARPRERLGVIKIPALARTANVSALCRQRAR